MIPEDPKALADDGRAMHDLVSRLYPLCRSITGQGVRDTLQVLGEHLPLQRYEVPTGTPVFDWTVPKEWNIRDAYIKDAHGRRVVDFHASNLHVVNYSVPIRRTMSLDDLAPHLHSLPEQPDLIPYRTTYYKEDWGFCLAHRDRLQLEPGAYEVVIDSTLASGHLTYGECVLPGATDDEVLIFTHVCHPSLANDNLSGMAVCAFLGARLARRDRRYTYRVVFAPGTIGSLVWLDRNRERLPRLRHGLVAVLLGDGGPLRYKATRDLNADIDRICRHVLAHLGVETLLDPFSPYGYDERQFAAPGFRLPVGRLSRSANGQYAEYHTSADNLDLVRPEALAGSLAALLAIVDVIEGDRRYVSASPYGEPQLGRRGLYRQIGGATAPADEVALLWTLMFSDGQHTLVDIADRAGMPFPAIRAAAAALREVGLLTEK